MSRPLAGFGQPGGSATFAVASPSDWGPWQRLASFGRLGAPVPLVFSSQFSTPDATAFGQDFNYQGFAQIVTSATAANIGFEVQVRIMYGSGGVEKTRVIDAQDISWQLPPCESARVDVRSREIASRAVLTVSLAPGESGERFATRTGCAVDVSAGAAATTVWAMPEGTKYVRPYVGNRAASVPTDGSVQVVNTLPTFFQDLASPLAAPPVVDLAVQDPLVKVVTTAVSAAMSQSIVALLDA